MEARMDASAGVVNRGVASRWDMLSFAPATHLKIETTKAPTEAISAGLLSFCAA
jgi:hypothetical protein